MKILVAGKGGVGKTTTSALLAYELSKKGYKVLALDTDSVPNLAQSLGLSFEEASRIVPLSRNDELAAERTGAKPGEGWGVFFSLTPKVDDLVEKYGIRLNSNLTLVVVGSIEQSKEGCLCPAIALAKAFLRHVLLEENEIVLVDSEAGAEVFGRGLAEKFDIMLCVAEPTLKSLQIAKKLLEMGKELEIDNLGLIVNKVRNKEVVPRLYSQVFSNAEIPFYMLSFDESVIEAENLDKGVEAVPEASPIKKDIKELVENLLS